MNKIQVTKSGTLIVNGIEYNEHPFPASLIKATEMKWALKLRDEGCIRLSSVKFYQGLENPELGDRNEAKGMLKVDGHPMEVGSGNEVFIWCSAIPEASPKVLKRLDASYDAIARIHDVEKFVKRIVLTAKLAGYKLYPHLGKVNYNRGETVSKDVLNNQRWHYNVFQKSSDYAHQMEYRLSFTNVTFQRIDKNHLDIFLGKCNDIITIET
ncbi:conserved hypothetical protein [Desulfosarcina cetonica]|uniref:hypothetical protein n=1 Tax=Desulfosarcina cetonica TaxID=90730 RepID=UPI0006CFF5C5|nr:hypothetical protein [Desulfosarcina cetonica]VTR68031.1 conserved hypothetical protein [Desulfosarcina cetonica]